MKEQLIICIVVCILIYLLDTISTVTNWFHYSRVSFLCGMFTGGALCVLGALSSYLNKSDKQ